MEWLTKTLPLNGGDSWASTKLVMNAQTICFFGRLSVWAWRRQLSEWPRSEWWSAQPLFRSAVALWALAHPVHAALHGNKAGGVCFRPTGRHQVARRAESEQREIITTSMSKFNVLREWLQENKTDMHTTHVRREVRRCKGVRLVSALCRWMRIWGIVCRPICSSVGEVVRGQSQGWGPEGQEREVRAASWAEESGSMREKNESREETKQWEVFI